MTAALARLAIAWVVMLGLALVASAAGLRVNTSASVPRGLYWLSSAQPARGDYVAVCPPRTPTFELARRRGYIGRGRCPGGSAELIKVLAAQAGDQVRIDRGGVRIGGRRWPSSTPRRLDGHGRPLPQLPPLRATLGREAVLVMSQDCAAGFDARYFGLLPRSAVIGTAALLVTW